MLPPARCLIGIEAVGPSLSGRPLSPVGRPPATVVALAKLRVEKGGRNRPSACPQRMTSGFEVDGGFSSAVLLDLVGDFLPFMETVEP